MDELFLDLCQAYDLLKQIPVRGADVDTMYRIRQKMQSAYRAAHELAYEMRKEKDEEVTE